MSDPNAGPEGTPADEQKPEGTPVGEQKPEGTPAGEQKPVEYKFNAPEGVTLDADDTAAFTALATEAKLPAEMAQKIVDLAVKREQARAESFASQVQAWGDAVKADKELGNPEALASAAKVVEKFGSDELKSLLNSTGMGNHPEVVRFVQKIAKAMSEDAVHGRGASGTEKKDAASILYGSIE